MGIRFHSMRRHVLESLDDASQAFVHEILDLLRSRQRDRLGGDARLRERGEHELLG